MYMDETAAFLMMMTSLQPRTFKFTNCAGVGCPQYVELNPYK